MIKQINTLLGLYVDELTRSCRYTDTIGVLNLSIDTREDFKYVFIKPNMHGWNQVQYLDSIGHTNNEELDIIIPFNVRVEEKLEQLEQITLNIIASTISTISTQPTRFTLW